MSNQRARGTKGYKWHGRTFKLVPVNKLAVDFRYQRDEGKKLAFNPDKMGEFDDRAIRSLVVSYHEDDGMYYILDGQNRTAFVRGLIGYDYLPAEVHYGLTFQEEADLFTKLNVMKNITAAVRFRSNLASGKAKEVAILNTATAVGLGLKLGRNKASGDDISSLGTLVWIYDKFGVNILRETLQVISEQFRTQVGLQEQAILRDFLKGLASYLKYSKKTAGSVDVGGVSSDAICKAANKWREQLRSDCWSQIRRWFEVNDQYGKRRQRKAA